MNAKIKKIYPSPNYGSFWDKMWEDNKFSDLVALDEIFLKYFGSYMFYIDT